MVQYIQKSFRQFFADPEIVALFAMVAGLVILLVAFKNILMPVFISVVIAYLLDWISERLQRLHVPRVLSVIIVYGLFLGLVIVALIGLLPMLWRQLMNLMTELPNTVTRAQNMLMYLPDKYPDYISQVQVQTFIDDSKVQLAKLGQNILSASVFFIPNIIQIIVYLVLVPMLVYFFLMDSKKLLTWCEQYLPKKRRLISEAWSEIHTQIGNYIGGKIVEMVIVWIACYALFAGMGLQYAMLLSALVGVSVIIPYIGAVIATIPIIVITFLQWGWSMESAYLLIGYAIITALDANLLVPLLFSEAVNLHPVAIMIAILVFGGIWGFWGVFFAIPLATVVKAVLNVMPNSREAI